MFDLIPLIKASGYIGLFGIIFAESGLFIGFFLPGDSLLFTAGFLSSQGFLNPILLSTLTFVAAVFGDNVGYSFGKKIGPMLFKKKESLLFNKENLERAKAFYEKYGPKTIVLARFMPVIRTFAPILAGVGKMKYSTFFFYNLAGGFIWTFGIVWGGYYLGNTIPNVDKYLLPIIAGIILLSISPSVIHVLKDKKTRDQILEFVKSKIRK
jgi:membrane-associated protein